MIHKLIDEAALVAQLATQIYNANYRNDDIDATGSPVDLTPEAADTHVPLSVAVADSVATAVEILKQSAAVLGVHFLTTDDTPATPGLVEC